MSMDGRYVENAGAYFRRCPWMDGMLKECLGFMPFAIKAAL